MEKRDFARFRLKMSLQQISYIAKAPLNPNVYQEPLLLIWLNLNPSSYIYYKVWDEIAYPFPNFNDTTVEVWKWISNFIPHFTGHVITYPC